MYQKKVDFADDDVLEVVFGAVVLELYVQTVLDTHLHLDAVVNLRLFAQRCRARKQRMRMGARTRYVSELGGC